MKRLFWLTAIVVLVGWPWMESGADRIADVRRTKHNLSVTDYSGGPQRDVKATSETQICVFCHTPHGATLDTGLKSPLWNRQLSTTTYTGTYESKSINADVNELRAGPGGTSKLCLSCHDGTLAIGSVNVLGGTKSASINMAGTGTGGKMPSGSSGASTGFTRNLGIDLSNDHPISFTFNATVATADGELRSPPYTSNGTLIMGNNVAGSTRPLVPLDGNQVQCASCHDPHIRDTVEVDSIKFLRLNRFQKVTPVGSTFSPSSDIICLACHDKGKKAWAESVHANSTDANETYKSGAGSAGALREFPTGTKVWQAACLNCHDTHTVSGSRRLLREGTDSTTSPKQGGNAATEETCYQCHRMAETANVLETTSNSVPNIRSDFTDVGNKHMPITTADQATPGTAEKHDITSADFEETQLSLGKGDLLNRHAECPDCHNPHRVMKNRLFNGSGAATAATHLHDVATQHSNLASGALRGTWGVEPTYTATTFRSLPTSYTVKKGDGGTGASTLRSSTYVTREYQVCLKCHSDYGYDDNNTYPAGNRPALGGSTGGGTASGTNGLTMFTNQAMEFGAAVNDATTGDDQRDLNAPTANRRSFHPVMWPTGRTLAERGGMANLWLSPWNGSSGGFIGNLTMYCSDCHGSATADGSSTPSAGKPWGPHGSTNNFILKGTWDTSTGSGQSSGICFRCHNYDNYATRNSTQSGFCCEKDSNLHGYHADKIGRMRCMWCHVAIPHGWKNKAFLVNLNDVGPEAGSAEGTQKRNGTTATYSAAPYYQTAILKVKTWKKSGSWTQGDCGSKGAPGNGETGRTWMRDGSEKCSNPP
ncbi:MAG: hypothetical protein HQL93_07135 [Magnetococcales bacterium]|nr:hypothetical protein [Magnetococcales bacterium]